MDYVGFKLSVPTLFDLIDVAANKQRHEAIISELGFGQYLGKGD